MQQQSDSESSAPHVKDGKVEEDEEELEADAQQALQFAHDGARVLERVGQVAAVVVYAQHRLLHVLCAGTILSSKEHSRKLCC